MYDDPKIDYKHTLHIYTHFWGITDNIHDFGRPFLRLHFFTCPPPVRPYFYPSTTVFTRPYDGWMGLCIKLCFHVTPGILWVLVNSFSHPLLLGDNYYCLSWLWSTCRVTLIDMSSDTDGGVQDPADSAAGPWHEGHRTRQVVEPAGGRDPPTPTQDCHQGVSRPCHQQTSTHAWGSC